MWSCCNRMISDGVKRCRTCGNDKPVIGFVDDVSETNFANKKKLVKNNKSNAHKNENNRKLSRLPKEEEGKFYISTFKQ